MLLLLPLYFCSKLELTRSLKFWSEKGGRSSSRSSTLISLQFPWAFNPSSPTSHCVSCLPLPPVASPFNVFCSQPPFGFVQAPPPSTFYSLSDSRSRLLLSCAHHFLHQSCLLQRSNEAETSVAVLAGQFERWFHVIKRGETQRAHCSSRVQRCDNETSGGLSGTRSYGSVW